jgi:hypothetical protein
MSFLVVNVIQVGLGLVLGMRVGLGHLDFCTLQVCIRELAGASVYIQYIIKLWAHTVIVYIQYINQL